MAISTDLPKGLDESSNLTGLRDEGVSVVDIIMTFSSGIRFAVVCGSEDRVVDAETESRVEM